MEIRDSLIQVELARAAGLRAVALINEAQAAAAALDVEMKREAQAQEWAGDFYHQRYHFIGDMVMKEVKHCMDVLSVWSRMHPGCDMEIVLCSPGGEVIPGLALFDHIRGLMAKGHKITTHASGYAGSMAGVILQAGTHRVMGRDAFVLIHETSGGVAGKIGEIEDATLLLNKMTARITELFLERAGGKITRASFLQRQKRKNWWLDAKECLKFGFIDEIR